jgi:hypothetical protein
MAVNVMESEAKTVEPEVLEVEKFVEEPVVVNPVLADTLWDQVEETISRVRELQVTQEDMYMKGLKEVINFNKQYRQSLVRLYRQTRETNREMVKVIFTSLTPNMVKADVDSKPENGELLVQVKEVYSVWEKIAQAPFKATLEAIDVFEENLEKGTESYVHFARERRNAWQELSNRYVEALRTNSFKLWDRK